MASHIPQSNELYNPDTGNEDIFNAGPFTDGGYDRSTLTDDIYNLDALNDELYNTSAVNEELYGSNVVDNPFFNTLVDSMSENDQSAQDVEELLKAIINVEGTEDGNTSSYQNFDPNLIVAPTMVPVVGPSMPQRTLKPRRGRQGPYTRRSGSRYSSDIASLSALQTGFNGPLQASGSRVKATRASRSGAQATQASPGGLLQASGSGAQAAQASGSGTEATPASGSDAEISKALDMARTLSNDPERFNEIIHRVGHMMWLTMFFLGALLLRENEIIVTQESEALIPHFAVQLELYGLPVVHINPVTKTKVISSLKYGRGLLKTQATRFLSTVLHVDDHIAWQTTRDSNSYITYVNQTTTAFLEGSFFHLPETTDAPYLFRSQTFRNAFLRIFYQTDNTCLAAKYPAAFTKGVTIEAMATFGAFVVHSAHHLKAVRLGNRPPDLDTSVYYLVYQKFLGWLQLELDAKNGLQEYLDAMSSEGSTWIPLVGPENAIRPLPTSL